MKRDRVLVTGGANGIGRAIVERSRADGYEPVVIDLVGDGIRADLSDPKETASKAGLQGMARVWALELGQYGITANAIGPGPIRTELFERGNPPDSPRTQAIINAIPVRRIGLPEDIAHAASFLLDARSGFVTGQVLYVCGGLTVGAAGA
jgi:NAD(P)-dependent dehydrogenase (short-subunit alcohol dehydrogenase family)